MRRWIVSVGIAAVAINAAMSSAAYRNFSERPLHEAAKLFDRTALLLQGTSSLRRDRMASIEQIADLRPDDPLRMAAARTALLAVNTTGDKGQRRTSYCTAVLIAPGTLITNHHCAFAAGKPFDAAEVWFQYVAPQTADVYPVLSLLEFDEKLDYALLRIALPPTHAALRGLQSPTTRAAVPGERAMIIHHAGGDVQQVSRAHCRVLVEQLPDKQSIRHSCPMHGGASGSLLIADDGAVLGLNHSHNANTVIGYATPFAAILARIAPAHRP